MKNKNFKILTLLMLFFSMDAVAQTWQNLTPEPTASFTDLAILDANTCYAVGLKGVIYKTTDGGASWQLINSGITQHINSVHAINGVVYATAEGGKILRCSNGTSFEQISLAEFNGNNIFFFDSQNGYCTGGKAGKLAKTTNGGASWDVVDISYQGVIKKLQFISQTLGFAISQEYDKVTEISTCVILKTTDGGITWTSIYSEANVVLNDLNFTDANYGYFVGNNGKIIKTSNGGTSYSHVISNTTHVLKSVQFTDDNTGYVVGIKGTILKTYNRGATWTALTSPKEYPFVSLGFEGNIGYVLVSGNRILKTTTGGI